MRHRTTIALAHNCWIFPRGLTKGVKLFAICSSALAFGACSETNDGAGASPLPAVPGSVVTQAPAGDPMLGAPEPVPMQGATGNPARPPVATSAGVGAHPGTTPSTEPATAPEAHPMAPADPVAMPEPAPGQVPVVPEPVVPEPVVPEPVAPEPVAPEMGAMQPPAPPVAPMVPATPSRAVTEGTILTLVNDNNHNGAHLQESLEITLAPPGLPLQFSRNNNAVESDAFDDVVVLVIHQSGGNDKQLSNRQKEIVRDFVVDGGSILALHNPLAHRRQGEDDIMRKLLGGMYNGHPAIQAFDIQVVNPNHPVTAGVTDYTITRDEQHTPVFELPQEHLLLRSFDRDDNLTASAGWWNEGGDLGRGRMVYLAMGHTPQAREHEMTQLLISNALNWLLHRTPEQ